MGHDIQFDYESNTVEVLRTMNDGIDALLLEVSAELVSQTASNTAVDTGQLKSSWAADVVKTGDKYTATIGSPLENAIWEEFGTGEYALKGATGIGYWVYVDDGSSGKSKPIPAKRYPLWKAKRIVAKLREEGLNAYCTKGKRARRPFWNAYTLLKDKLIRHMQSEFRRRLL